MSSIGDLTLDIKVGGDTKTLDATIAKVKSLNDQVVNLNKNLKTTDKGLNLKTGGTSSGSSTAKVKNLTEEQAARKKLKLAQIDFGFTKLKAQQENLNFTAFKRERSEKERAERIEKKAEKDRNKERDKDAKKFFGILHNGFDKAAKLSLGVLTGGAGVVGAALLAGQKAASVANVSTQQGLNSQDLQRWRNVLVQANPTLDPEQALGIIGNLQATLAKQASTGESANALMALGLNPGERNAFKVLEAIREKEFASPDIKTLLESNLGIDPAAANALTKNGPNGFSDADFLKALSMPILSEKEIKANEDFARAVATFKNSVNTFTGKILASFAPAAEKIVDTITHPEAPGNKEKISTAKGTVAVYAALGGILGLGVRSPFLGAALGTAYGSYRAAKKLAQTDTPAEGDIINAHEGLTPLPKHLKAEELRFNRKEMDDYRGIIGEQYKTHPLSSTSPGAKSVLIQPTVNNNFNIGEVNQSNLPTIQRGIENSSQDLSRSMYNSVNQAGANY